MLQMARMKRATSATDGPTSTCAQLDTGSEAALIDFLLQHVSVAGDGINLKALTFKKAAIHLIPFTVKGGANNERVCKNKWSQLHALH